MLSGVSNRQQRGHHTSTKASYEKENGKAVGGKCRAAWRIGDEVNIAQLSLRADAKQ
jgi:hypothetical protein